MKVMGKFYLTTTLPYVNDRPHIGFALEIVQADALVRFWKSEDREVFFNTGTDEHGQKIYDAAAKAGKDVEEYVNYYADEFKKLKETLGISEDLHFIRTTDPGHVNAAQEMWKRCAANGDIYDKEYEGLYCVGCEKFLTEKEIINGKCHIHGTELQLLKEKNYFFRLKKYQDLLLEYLSKNDVIVPEWRRTEAINFVKEGLEDFSISREKRRLAWGVPVPGDDTQIMYVWFDALTSYISTLGWPDDPEGNFKKFWEGGYTLQMAGKDQVRFQSIMWQAMLMSAGVKNTDQVFYHGFINSGGEKMSKSIGNVISPDDLVKKYGVDATRYILLRHVHSTEDTNVTWEKLDEWYTADLANGLGNLVARVMKLSEEYLQKPILKPEVIGYPKEYVGAFAGFQFNHVADLVWEHIQILDNKIASEKPYNLVKENPEEGKRVIQECAGELLSIGKLLQPLMPETSNKILEALTLNKKPENLFPRLD